MLANVRKENERGCSSLEEKVKRVSQRKQYGPQHHLILLQATDNIDGDIRLELVANDPLVVEETVASVLLCCLG